VDVPIYVVSGGVGASGEQIVRTALAQFDAPHMPVVIMPHIRHPGEVERIVAEAGGAGGTIVHTFVDPHLRQWMLDVAQAHQVPAFDLLGPLIDHLAALLGQQPRGQPGRYRQLHAASFARVEAIEWTLAHDDGQKPYDWPAAEIVLAGISRVGKTPTSIYLAVLGWKVANVTLVPPLAPPPELLRLDRRRVVGLSIDPVQLVFHRRGRQRRLDLPLGSAYIDPEQVMAELAAAQAIFRHAGFRTIDVTDKAIEHIADEVLALTNPEPHAIQASEDVEVT
jgi:regulator of PEP synthase PpsR (kinase-PPPase family)